jgi:DNA-binding LytR/AlgR family response regulator
MKNLFLPTNESVHVGGRKHVQPEQVIMLVADVNYTTIYLIDGQQFMVATTIGKVQKALDAYGNFIRLNKAQVVNWAYVLQRTKNGLLLKNNETVGISRRRRRDVKVAIIHK